VLKSSLPQEVISCGPYALPVIVTHAVQPLGQLCQRVKSG